MTRPRMERPGGLFPDGRDDLGVTMAEEQSAVAHDVADELVTVQIPFARPRGPADGQRERVREAHVVSNATGQQEPGPGIQGRRTRVLGGPPPDQAAVSGQGATGS